MNFCAEFSKVQVLPCEYRQKTLIAVIDRSIDPLTTKNAVTVTLYSQLTNVKQKLLLVLTITITCEEKSTGKNT